MSGDTIAFLATLACAIAVTVAIIFGAHIYTWELLVWVWTAATWSWTARGRRP
jgi:hypothetical protein